MVAGSQQQQPQTSQSQHQQPQNQPQQQQQQQKLPVTTPSSAQDEALKRNTDCVYFLASPLTCKKGSECEYRHSEYARVNPRDCWYWLNGNCLNPKCSFRHPPFDSFLGTPGTPTAGQSVPVPQIAASSTMQAPYNSSKQAVPCIFFQKGLCLKGDRCAFLHGPSPNISSSKVPQVPVTNQGGEPPTLKNALGDLEKCKLETKIRHANVAKLAEISETKPAPMVETHSNKNVIGSAMHAPLPPSSTGFKNEASRFKITNTPLVTNGTSVPRSNRLHQARVSDDHSFHSGKESDEFPRESSPGFDVLVADELRNSDYYHGEDGNKLDSVSEYDLGHPDYNPMADIDRERFHVQPSYDSFDHMRESYAWEQHRNSSERIYGASSHLERTHGRSNSPENVEVSDLRHHLSKRRRVSGLKSVVSHDYIPESHGEEHGQHFSRKDLHQLPLNESSLSNRLRGRIKLPANDDDNHLKREADRGRNRNRLSPGRRLQTPHQGRLRDRLRGSVHDDYERKSFWGRLIRREMIGDSSADFSGPKSLAELKVGKNTDNKEQQSLGKRKSSRDHRQYDDDLFDGPKPLSEILKEKRGTGAEASSQSGTLSDNKRDIKESEVANGSENNTAISSAENGALAVTKQDLPINEGQSKSSEVGRDMDKTNKTHGQSSEDGIIYDETMEDQVYEGDDNQRDDDYDYEQGDEGDYNYVECENAEQDEYVDDEDGDDFAKKIGVVLT